MCPSPTYASDRSDRTTPTACRPFGNTSEQPTPTKAAPPWTSSRTAASGFDLGYHGYVVTDATATVTSEVQDASEKLLEAFIARLVTSQQAAAMLSGTRAS
jgi:hypothetical protein